jgi:hypothetical protein
MPSTLRGCYGLSVAGAPDQLGRALKMSPSRGTSEAWGWGSGRYPPWVVESGS